MFGPRYQYSTKNTCSQSKIKSLKQLICSRVFLVNYSTTGNRHQGGIFNFHLLNLAMVKFEKIFHLCLENSLH